MQFGVQGAARWDRVDQNFSGGMLCSCCGSTGLAIPHYIGHSYLMGILDRFEIELEKTLVGKVL